MQHLLSRNTIFSFSAHQRMLFFLARDRRSVLHHLAVKGDDSFCLGVPSDSLSLDDGHNLVFLPICFTPPKVKFSSLSLSEWVLRTCLSSLGLPNRQPRHFRLSFAVHKANMRKSLTIDLGTPPTSQMIFPGSHAKSCNVSAFWSVSFFALRPKLQRVRI